MCIFTYHIVKISFKEFLKLKFKSFDTKSIEGLLFAQQMHGMTLGASLYSISRIKWNSLVLFAQWEDKNHLHLFLKNHRLGKIYSRGFYIELKAIRQTGSFEKMQIKTDGQSSLEEGENVAALTIAKMKLFELFRFLKWGRPVEKLVRDHPSAIYSNASLKFLNTISTFSIWKNVDEMQNMVLGKSEIPNANRHHAAMYERDRKDFYKEFSTIRFKIIETVGEFVE